MLFLEFYLGRTFVFLCLLAMALLSVSRAFAFGFRWGCVLLFRAVTLQFRCALVSRLMLLLLMYRCAGISAGAVSSLVTLRMVLSGADALHRFSRHCLSNEFMHFIRSSRSIVVM